MEFGCHYNLLLHTMDSTGKTLFYNFCFAINNLNLVSLVCCRNEATNIHNKGTILALSNGQYYIHNIFHDPENNYEIIATYSNNRSQ